MKAHDFCPYSAEFRNSIEELSKKTELAPRTVAKILNYEAELIFAYGV